MISGLLMLIVYLCVLAIAVWILRALFAQMNFPPVATTITIGVACIIALILIANFLGAGIPIGV